MPRIKPVVEIDPTAWQSALSDLTQKLMATHAEFDWSWVSGGCFAFAEAFQATYGGELYGVCKPETVDRHTDFPVQHAIVKYGDSYYDFEGEFDASSVKSPCVILRKDDEENDVAWFMDEFLSDRQHRELRRILRKCYEEAVEANINRLDLRPRMR